MNLRKLYAVESIASEKMKKIMDMAKEDRPYEKCLRLGPEALSDGELLAVLLRTGTKGCPSVDMADEILNLSRNKEGLLGLYQLSLTQLQSVKGKSGPDQMYWRTFKKDRGGYGQKRPFF